MENIVMIAGKLGDPGKTPEVKNRQRWNLFHTSGHESAKSIGPQTPTTTESNVPTIPTMTTLETGGRLRNRSSGLLPPSPFTNPRGIVFCCCGAGGSECSAAVLG